ncbi:MAG TPA: hypothetical protein VK789_10455 [Bryobacteraceae bacterium]|nr:hypothetical protein [Bryobacteraceae bacterium]
MLKTYVGGSGLPDIAPHDLRRTTAKLPGRGRGTGPDSIAAGPQFNQTTERYLGTKQHPANAPNDAIKLKLAL